MQSLHRTRRLILVAGAALALAAGGTVQAGVARVYKYETVYTTLKSDGKPADVTVVDWLRIYGSGSIEILDPARLTEIRNLRGPERPQISDRGLLWKVNSKGLVDLQYSGKSSQSLPLEVQVSYKYNGKPARAEEIVGKSGQVEVRARLINKLGPFKSSESGPAVFTPITVNATVEVPMDRCDDIQSEGAMSTLVGSKMRFSWLVFPDPEALLVYSFKSTRIEFSSIDVAVIPRMPPLSDFEFATQLMPIQDALDTIDSAMGDCVSGSHQLQAGQTQLNVGLAELQKGLTDLLTLSSAHYQILEEVNRSLQPFSDQMLNETVSGFKQLSQGLTTTRGAVSQLKQLNDAHVQIARQLKQGMDGIDMKQLESIPSSVAQMSDGLNQVEVNLRLLALANQGQAQVVQQLYDANVQALAGLESFEKKNKMLALSKEYREMKDSVKLQIEVLKALKQGGTVQGQRLPGLDETAGGAEKLADGVHEVLAGVNSVNSVAGQYVSGFENMKTAVNVLAQGGTIQGQKVPGLDTAAQGLSALESGVAQMDTSVNGFMGRISELLKLRDLRSAIAVLFHGGKVQGREVPGMDTTVKGLQSAAEGSKTAYAASKDLAVGQVQLAEGLGRLRTEGIVPMRAAVKEGVEKIARMNSTVGIMIRRVRNYDSFTGKPAGAVSEVRFLYRIPAIKPAVR